MSTKKLNVSPLGGHILVKPMEEEKRTTAGIVLPDTAEKEKKQKGKVVAVGTGKLTTEGKKISFNVKVGDSVIFKKYSPEELEIDGEDYLIMEEDDILAIIEA